VQSITQARSYRATLIPHNIELDDVESHAARGMLPTLRVKAPDAETAAADAYRVSGKRVLRVERIEVAA
jgi:hypothetical protein